MALTSIKTGDIVARASYGKDVFFKVADIFRANDGKHYAQLKGLDLRLQAVAPLNDLVRIDPKEVAVYWHDCLKKNADTMKRVLARRMKERQQLLSMHRSAANPAGDCGQNDVEGFDVPGQVLHIDGDKDYLDLCMTTYKSLMIPADGYCIEEAKQASAVTELLEKHHPDILVLTGHDGFMKGKKDFRDIGNYHNTTYFVDAVKAARNYEKSRDDLVIFAGACQSHYESLLNCGANFASSPRRVLIHAFDPVFVVERIAMTSIYDKICIKDVIASTITGFDGIGGMETRGKYRFGLPMSPY